MTRPADDDLFARYRVQQALTPEARARTLRKLQERVLHGDLPLLEASVPPPALVHGSWSLLLSKWTVILGGLGVGALLVLNQHSTPTAAETAPPDRSAQLREASPGARFVPTQPPSSEHVLPPSTAAWGRERHLLGNADIAAASTDKSPQAQYEPAVRVPGRSQVALSGASRPPGEAGVSAASTNLSTQTQAPRDEPAVRGRNTAASSGAQRLPSKVELEAASTDKSQRPLGVHALIVPGRNDAALRSQGRAEVAAADTDPHASKVSAATPERANKPTASETLAKEVQLIQAAQLALRADDTQRSLALLAEHTWSYPQGQLAEARDVARILALCQAGNITQSQLHAKRFLQQRPASPYAARVSAGCTAPTNTTSSRSETKPEHAEHTW